MPDTGQEDEGSISTAKLGLLGVVALSHFADWESSASGGD
jgi:hypothetical protein